MPIFEYKCLKCKKKFEKLILKDEKVECPECGSEDVKKLISSFLHQTHKVALYVHRAVRVVALDAAPAIDGTSS